jgi:hypothetical protein
MSPRVLSSSPAKSEKIALLELQAPLDPEPAPDPESKPKRRDAHFEDRINPRWLRIDAAVEYSGINRSRLFKLIAEGAIKTACLKEHHGAKRGLRLVDRFSLDLFLETLSKPIEEQLVQQANELHLAEEALAKEREDLAKKQRTIQQQLAEIRKQKVA